MQKFNNTASVQRKKLSEALTGSYTETVAVKYARSSDMEWKINPCIF